MNGFIKNPDLEVHWLGWHTSLYQLQSAGWSFEIHKEPRRMATCWVFRHETLELIGWTADTSWNPIGNRPLIISSLHSINANVKLTAPLDFSETLVHEVGDLSPGYLDVSVHNPADITHAFSKRKTETLLIEKADMSVLEHLEEIKRKQAAGQKELRERFLGGECVETLHSLDLVKAA